MLLWKYRDLWLSLARREVIVRYRGSAAGVLWSFFTPLLMLAVYTFFFGFVFNSRWSGEADSKAGFAMMLFPGLMIFNLFSECISRSPVIITSNPNYVKKVVFPLEIVSMVIVGPAMFHFVVNLTAWLLFHLVFVGWPPLTITLLPLLLVPHFIFLIGCAWGLAAVGVIFRDLAQITSIATSALMFTSPVFFSLSALPKRYYHFIMLNPLSWLIETVRGVMLDGKVPELLSFINYFAFCLLVFFSGFFIFQRTRPLFADIV